MLSLVFKKVSCKQKIDGFNKDRSNKFDLRPRQFHCIILCFKSIVWREFEETRNYGGTIGDLDLLLPLRGVGFSNSISLLSLKHPKRLRFLILSLEPLRCLSDIICF